MIDIEYKGSYNDLTERRISSATCEKYGVTSVVAGGKSEYHYYPYTDEHGNVVATKRRECATKGWFATGDNKDAVLFGQSKCRGNGKFITITEGEVDCLAVSEMFGRKYDVVSIRNGAGSAVKELRAQLEWLESYESIVLCFDTDKEGMKAVEKCRDLFQPGKLKIVALSEKDAGAMLAQGKAVQFLKEWWDAKVYRPDGIVAGEDTWDALVNQRSVKSTPYPWAGLNELTRGHRRGELVTVTSGSGMGKSQLMRELEYDLLQRCTGNIGILPLEEDTARAALGIMSCAANRPLHLEEDTPIEDLRPYWESTMGSGRYYILDHWGSTTEDNLLARCRYMAKGLQCDYIVLDHLSIVVSSQDGGDERKAIDGIMTKLRTLVAESGITLFLVSHLKRSSGQAHEDGGRISLSELRGSQAIAQLSDMVIGLERDQQNPDETVRNTTVVRVLKNRYTGETGPACYLYYDKKTGRMVETDKPEEETPEF